MITAERTNTKHADKLASTVQKKCLNVCPMLSNQEPLTMVLRFDSKSDYDKMAADLQAGRMGKIQTTTGYAITKLEPVFQTAANSLAHLEIKPMQFQFANVKPALQGLLDPFKELSSFLSFTCETNPDRVIIPSVRELCNQQSDNLESQLDHYGNSPAKKPFVAHSRSKISECSQASLCVLVLLPSEYNFHSQRMRDSFMDHNFFPVATMAGMTPSQQFEKYYSFPRLPEYPLSTLPAFGLYVRQSPGGGTKPSVSSNSAAVRLNMYAVCDLSIMEQFYSSILDQKPFKGREGNRFFLIYSLSSVAVSNVELYIYYCPDCKVVVTEGVTLHFLVSDLVLAANRLGENLLRKHGHHSYMTVDPQEHLVILHAI
ncbi:uncharacterized protein LOC134188765 isoform X2 [Corticium candelabrum]|nr:uncharacterized protein LOC134188765 isoform X2 [Corticium candelabrum]